MVKIQQSTEERILEAAKKIFHRKGFDGTRMQEIADEAGINKSLVHYYFRTKENLFNSIFRAAFSEIFSNLMVTAGSGEPLDRKVQRLVEDYIGFLQENSRIPGFILSEMNQNPERIVEAIETFPIKPKAILEKISQSVGDENLHGIDPRELYINIFALCIFPVAAKPVLKTVFGFSEKEYSRFLEKRKRELPDFIMNAIRKK